MSDFIGHYQNVVSEADCMKALKLLETKGIESKSFRDRDSQVDYMFESFFIETKDKDLKAINNIFKEASDKAIRLYFDENKISGMIGPSDFKYSHSTIDLIKKHISLPIHFDREFNEKTFKSKRNFIIVIYLNTLTEGGELVFPIQGKAIKPKMGDLVIIPTFYSHPHYVNPSLYEDRYSYHLTYNTINPSHKKKEKIQLFL